MWQEFPAAGTHSSGAEIEEEIEWVKQFILGIRQIRGEMDISPGKSLPVLLENSEEKDRAYAERNAHLLTRVGRVESVRPLAADETVPESASALLGNMRLLVPMAGIIDVEAEKARLGRLRERGNTDLERVRARLENPDFVNNAPPAVVTNTRQQLADLEMQLSQLDEQMARLAGSS